MTVLHFFHQGLLSVVDFLKFVLLSLLNALSNQINPVFLFEQVQVRKCVEGACKSWPDPNPRIAKLKVKDQNQGHGDPKHPVSRKSNKGALLLLTARTNDRCGDSLRRINNDEQLKNPHCLLNVAHHFGNRSKNSYDLILKNHDQKNLQQRHD